MKVARTVLGGGNFSNKTTYLARPYAALLSLIIDYDRQFSDYKVIDLWQWETFIFLSYEWIGLGLWVIYN